MTYCVAFRLDSGMLFCSDSRTNAGVDHIATFCKMKVFEQRDDRVMVLLSSGNLSVTQSVINMLDKHRSADPGVATIWSADSLYDVACMVGDALREVQRRDGPFLAQGSVEASASMILGGQIRGEDQRLFHIYPARQLHRGDLRHDLLPAGRKQIWQTGAGPRHHHRHPPR